MKRSRAMDALHGLDPAGGDPGSPDSPQARRMLASVMAADDGGPPPRSPRRGRAVTFALVAVIAVAAGFGLWKAFGPVLSNHSNRPVGRTAVPTPGPTTGRVGTPLATTAPTEPAAPQMYEVTATVQQFGDEGPEICLGGRTLPLPPSKCGRVPITNWDWDQVKGEQRSPGDPSGNGYPGDIEGDYHLTGTFDGTSFTVTDVGPPRTPPDSADDFTPPCETPTGGWIAPDPSRTGQVDLDKANRLAAHEPDFAGLWVYYVVEPGNDGSSGPNDMVITAAFTGDLERHRQALEQVWGGPLCVVQFDHSQDELTHIQNQLTNTGAKEFGFSFLGDGVDVVHNRVEVDVVFADEAMQAAVDQRYGPGVVVLSPELKPVTATASPSPAATS